MDKCIDSRLFCIHTKFWHNSLQNRCELLVKEKILPYCENCGAELSAGARFCEECGAEIDSNNEPVATNILKDGNDNLDYSSTFIGDWREKWTKAAQATNNDELGIILTDIKALATQLSCSNTDLSAAISSYTISAKERGVHYHLLDLGNNGISNIDGKNVQAMVNLLKTIVSFARPKYLLILGNEEIVNVNYWENKCADHDDEVAADLPYATLNTTSPWEGQKYDFSQVLRVGRIPSYRGERLAQFAIYFKNALAGINSINRIVPYGLSALVWEAASAAQYNRIACSKIDTSPSVTLENIKGTLPQDANILYFNLHGSDQTKFWYGQEGFSYPETFSPETIKSLKGPYFLGVEACYGARYTDGLTADDSIVLSAMQNGCLALLGSSKIAYGPCVPPANCADIVIGTFLKKICDGESAGDAYCEALTELMNSETPDDSTIKTLAEFSLYGDPSARTRKNIAKSILSKAIAGASKGIHVPMPNIRRTVNAKLVDADCKAVLAYRNNPAKFVANRNFNIADYLQDVEPKYYQVGQSNLYQAVYNKMIGLHKATIKVYFDENGNVKKELFSK